MGEVAAMIRVMPEGVDTDLAKLQERLENSLPEGVRVHGFKVEPVAFGIKALMVTVILPDTEGGTDAVEAAFSEVEGVESVQVVEVGLI
ncbi:MAG TPA: elongation factor 1-beta [Candidatus Syntrophoarchaeum butanivorans]|uniref:Elongation factor 1-beta n=1 Tax=Candidatus Syntropharchaeum butanivorans TaxID=1839936 RepID=A0A7C1B6F5_9EURY|nr:elongation factor 1-beta [Candidatus Syntrophoarchaeum butanivorans]